MVAVVSAGGAGAVVVGSRSVDMVVVSGGEFGVVTTRSSLATVQAAADTASSTRYERGIGAAYAFRCTSDPGRKFRACSAEPSAFLARTLDEGAPGAVR